MGNDPLLRDRDHAPASSLGDTIAPPRERALLDRLELEDLVVRQSTGGGRLSMVVQVAVVVVLFGVFALMLVHA